MDMTLLGETIRAAGTQTHYGFWLPARGNDGVVGVEVFYCSSNKVNITMETKSTNDDDSAAVTITASPIAPAASSTPTNYSAAVSDAKDLVRYKVATTAAVVVHLQFAQPLWQPN